MRYPAMALVALLACSRGLCASGSEEQQPLRAPEVRITTLEEFEKFRDGVNQLEWRIHDIAAKLVDFSDQPLDFALESYGLPVEKKQEIDTLHEKAEQAATAGDAAAMKAAFDAVEAPAREQVKRAIMGGSATDLLASLMYHKAVLQPWLARGAPADIASANEQARTLVEAAKKGLEASLKSTSPNWEDWRSAFYQATRETRNAVWAALNAERKRLMAEQAALPNPVVVAARVRDKPCPASVKGAPEPSDAVRIGSGFPPAEGYYPELPKHTGVEGPVVVRVLVSETACAQRVEVVQTSGARALDEGALAYALDGVYVPRARDGQPIPGEIVFRINFELRD